MGDNCRGDLLDFEFGKRRGLLGAVMLLLFGFLG
jgi:hypothetical protein